MATIPFPTNCYPQITYATSRTIVFELPATVANPGTNVMRADNFAASGKRETVVLRTEETRAVGLAVSGGRELEELRRFYQDRGLRGQQFELAVDRYTGRVFTMANTVVDTNGDPASYSLAPVWATISGQPAWDLPASGTLTIATNGGSLSSALTASGGTLVLVCAPQFASSTGSAEVFLDISSGGINASRVLVWMTAANELGAQFWWGTGSLFDCRWSPGAPLWTVGDVVTIVARWSNQTTPVLWFNSNQTTSAPTTHLGCMATLPATLTLHSRVDLTLFAAMRVLLFGTYRYPYDDPTILTSWYPVGRNYYATAELTDQAFAPQPLAPGTDLWQVPLTVRVGQ